MDEEVREELNLLKLELEQLQDRVTVLEHPAPVSTDVIPGLDVL